MKRRAFCSAAALSVAIMLGSVQAHAQSSVNTIIVGLSPGGSMDGSARLMADRLQKMTGETFVVENRTGAGGRVAAGYTHRAKPDGRTIMIAPHGPMTLSQHLYRNLGFDPINDFDPVAKVAAFEYVLVAGPDVPVTNRQELAAWVKENPGLASYGSPGTGSTPHFIGEIIAKRLGVEMTNVPYKGSALTVNDVVSGILSFGIMPTADALPMAKAGRLKIVGTSGAERSRLAPEYPTLREIGIDFALSGWYAMFAPKGTSPERVAQLSQAFGTILEDEDVVERLSLIGLDAQYASAEELAAVQRQESEMWAKVVKEMEFPPLD